jgi:N-acetyl sugar amidotransferase
MDTTDPNIEFDDKGVCNHCHHWENVQKKVYFNNETGEKKFLALVDKIKNETRGKTYNCILGLSGGVDSTYVAYLTKKHGLNALAVHMDSGWNSELAVKNIENIIKKLKFDLYTHVIDWDEMRDLQLSYFKAGVANCDVPTDHAITAILYKLAEKNGIKYIMSGSNLATECILPFAWGYDAKDSVNLKAIQKKYGKVKLKNYPTRSFYKTYIYDAYLSKFQTIRPLNYIEYNKLEAMKIIKSELEWREYGGKHYESVFTRFFQGYYLPVKQGFDKKRAHLASLIQSGQMTRDEALRNMDSSDYPDELMLQDREFVAKKLGLSVDEFEGIMDGTKREFSEFKSAYPFLQMLRKVKSFVRLVK